MASIILSSCTLKKQPFPENLYGDITVGTVAVIHAGKAVKIRISRAGLNQGAVEYDAVIGVAGEVVLSSTTPMPIFQFGRYAGKFVASVREAETLTVLEFVDNAINYPAISFCVDSCIPGLGAQVITLENAPDFACSDCSPCSQ